MELLYLISLLLLPISISLLLILSSLGTQKDSTSNNLPPGKTGWPVIGESLELISWSLKGIPERFYSKRIKLYSSEIFRTSLFGQHMTVMCGPEANKLLFSTASHSVASWWPSAFGKIFTTDFQATDSYNEHSLRKRKLIVGLLKPESLKKYAGLMDAVAQNLLPKAQQGSAFTVYPLAKRYTFDVACKAFLSLDDQEHIARIFEPFSVLLAGLFSVPINLPGFPLRRAVKAANIIRKELVEMVKQRKIMLSSSTSDGSTVGRNDLLFVMITTADEIGEFMDEYEIANTILGLLIAGYDTASIVCTFVINYMAELPHVYEKVYQEQVEIARRKQPGELLTWEDLQKMSYSWNVASEAMRMMPPAQVSFRQALLDLTFAGFSIPKGSTIVWSPNSTQKDPKYFPEPEKFDPARFQENKIVPYTYVPFGGGPRMCPGNEYARMQILVFMHNMVKTFRWEKIIPNERILIDPMPRLQKGLPIRLYPH